jgi:hypothetical protein
VLVLYEVLPTGAKQVERLVKQMIWFVCVAGRRPGAECCGHPPFSCVCGRPGCGCGDKFHRNSHFVSFLSSGGL